jgi:hypothetical protein
MNDVILFQRISGGWEYRYATDYCEEYVAWAETGTAARAKLARILGWPANRFNKADFRKF